jgi:hypothetical protein
MRYVLSVLLTLAWALWFGGQATLVILIMTLFIKDRPIAVRAGPYLFHVFERYQLVLAGIAILCAIVLWIMTRRRVFSLMLGCFVLAGIGGLISTTMVTHRMEQLWRENQADSPEFASLHQKSRALYNTEFTLLLAAGCMLPGALRVTSPRTVSTSDQAKSLPV